MDDMAWVHTVPCDVCKGQHAEYIRRPGCLGCVALLENLEARRPHLVSRPTPVPSPPKPKALKQYDPWKQRAKKMPMRQRMEQVGNLRRDGKTTDQIAAVTGLSERTVYEYFMLIDKEARRLHDS